MACVEADDTEMPVVLVTGASGFLASHIVKQLLEDGCVRVRGSLRDASNKDLVDGLRSSLAPQLGSDERGILQFVSADLNDADCWKSAVEGCQYVIHTASPFPVEQNPADGEESIVKPAVAGVNNVLAACRDAGCVKRVVLTSSSVSIRAYGPALPEDGPDKIYTEEEWMDENSPHLDAYSRSKLLAEKAAWSFVKEMGEDKKFELVVMNPSLMLGPLLTNRPCTSMEFVKRLLGHEMPLVPKLNFGMIDVRDSARAHIKAMTAADAADNRHILCNENLWMKEVAVMLSAEFKGQGYCVPTKNCPYFVMWAMGRFDKSVRQLLPQVGVKFKLSNKRMLEVLGVETTDAKKTVLDMAYSLIELGIVKKSKKSRSTNKSAKSKAGKEGEKQKGSGKETGEGTSKEGEEEKEAPATVDITTEVENEMPTEEAKSEKIVAEEKSQVDAVKSGEETQKVNKNRPTEKEGKADNAAAEVENREEEKEGSQNGVLEKNAEEAGSKFVKIENKEMETGKEEAKVEKERVKAVEEKEIMENEEEKMENADAKMENGETKVENGETNGEEVKPRREDDVQTQSDSAAVDPVVKKLESINSMVPAENGSHHVENGAT